MAENTPEFLDSYAFFEGEFVPLSEAKVNIATHALNYGTGCFEGLRAYWSPEEEQLHVVKMKEHYQRLQKSCRILNIDPGYTVDEMGEITLQLLRKNEPREDTYIRPLAFKSEPNIRLALTGLQDSFGIFTVPLGDYLDTSRGLKLRVSSWQRLDDNALPPRGKVTGAYINACLSSDEATRSGYDESIVLTADGHVSEASSANLFLVRDGVLITTPVSDGILEGITRRAVLHLAETMEIEQKVRTVDRTELYIADEAFLCGTGVQIAPVTEIDDRPVGEGTPGPITLQLQKTYFQAVRGEDPSFAGWLTPVY